MCYKIIVRLIMFLYVLQMILVLVNLWTGCYFYFEDNKYCRGPLNKLGFVVMTIEVFLFCLCYFRNRKLITPNAGQLIRTLPPLVIVMTIIQLLIPDTLLTGIIAAIANLIIFACFQNNRIGRDAMTELPNRSSFFRELQYHKKKGHTLHVILIHLCNMDKVNKRFSMKTGDTLIYNVARYLENLEVDYQVYRYGNTHFMMFGEMTAKDAAEDIANCIYDRFNQPWVLQGEQWLQQIQMIHMELPTEEMDENQLTDRLNYLLSYSKNENCSSRLFFGDKLKKDYERKRYVLAEVKKAIQNDSFVLNFQPVYSCADEKFISAEVLLRLYTEDGAAISPGEFIPIAEENGLTDEISWFVLKNSMAFLMRHPRLPLESISINMSIEQMNKSFFEDKLRTVGSLYSSQLNRLRVEITENAISENPALVTQIMNVLVDSGLNFYLDDFGMGYSNFSRVFDLPFEVVKLDKSLIQKIDVDEKAYQIVNSLVNMLHNAGFIVLAEGAERESQVKMAKEIGIDRIQGFYYAKPMNESALIEFLPK